MITNLNISIPARAKTPSTTLFVQIIAEDAASLKTKPYLFMLPGGPGGNHSSYQVYSCLTDVGNIVFHDPRGCGLSAKGARNTYTMDNYIADVAVIRQELQLEKIILLGKSYGAMCALGFTLQFPDYVSQLILAAGSPNFKNLETAAAFVSQFGNTEQQQAFDSLLQGNFSNQEELNQYFNTMDSLYSFKKKQGIAINRPIPQYPCAYEPLNQGFSDFLRDFDYENQLPDIQCDTLILVGEEDWITAPKHSALMAEKIPNNQFIQFANASHSLELDLPEAFFGAIRTFVKAHYT